MLSRLLQRVSLRRQRAAAPPSVQSAPTLMLAIDASMRSFDSWIDERLASASTYVGLAPASDAILRSRMRHRVGRLVAAADRLLAHEFDLLGSGRYVPDAGAGLDGAYRRIDWMLDPVASTRFPATPIAQWTPALAPAGSDIKRPWELGRCQHWVALAQACSLTGDLRYADEVRRQCADFTAANPVGVGVNWLCTMDVGIRAANWAIAFDLLRTAGIERAFWRDAYASLFDHCVFIEGHLENTYEVTSNHFLSDVVGLSLAAAPFGSLPHGAAWTTRCREWVEQEMCVQVLGDGADFESSVPYHRLVAELFLGAARLAGHVGAPLSPPFMTKLRAMIDFFAAVQRPDGLMPQVGDADDGRLHNVDYGGAAPQDGRHLFGAAAAVFGSDEWTSAGGETAEWEAAWWGGAIDAEPAAERRAPARGLFPDAGIAVARDGGTYLLVTNGRVGTKGFGNHKHNDQLSFEYHAHGCPLIVDPGSYVYTSDPDARNLFRSTRSHNTVCVDDVEQNDMRPEWLFRLFETANAEQLGLDVEGDRITYAGRHRGYERLPHPVTHERVLRLDAASGALHIIDTLRGGGAHTLRWHFHLAPSVAAEIGDGAVRLTSGGRAWTLTFAPAMHASVDPAHYSPSYGVRLACLAVNLTLDATLADECRAEFDVSPCD